MTATAFVKPLRCRIPSPPTSDGSKTAITGEFSLAEVVEAVKNAPLVQEQRMDRRGIEADAAGKKP
jgi:hypothetical protein